MEGVDVGRESDQRKQEGLENRSSIMCLKQCWSSTFMKLKVCMSVVFMVASQKLGVPVYVISFFGTQGSEGVQFLELCTLILLY